MARALTRRVLFEKTEKPKVKRKYTRWTNEKIFASAAGVIEGTPQYEAFLQWFNQSEYRD